MAVYHVHVKVISRAAGHSAVAASAYRSASRILDAGYDVVREYTVKMGVEESDILLPAEAPAWAADREILWNTVESAEKRKDAQLAREVEFSLPVEMTLAQQSQLAREFINANFVSKGMVADYAIHDRKDGNPHCHVMLTTRAIERQGFGGKVREWNNRDLLIEWRKDWADRANARMAELGINQRIDHRTLKAQGINREPTKHRGKALENWERRIKTRIDQLGLMVDEHGQVVEKTQTKAQQNATKLAAIMGGLQNGERPAHSGIGGATRNSAQRDADHSGAKEERRPIGGEPSSTPSLGELDRRIAEERRQRDIKAGLIPASDKSKAGLDSGSGGQDEGERAARNRAALAELERRNRELEKKTQREREQRKRETERDGGGLGY